MKVIVEWYHYLRSLVEHFPQNGVVEVYEDTCSKLCATFILLLIRYYHLIKSRPANQKSGRRWSQFHKSRQKIFRSLFTYGFFRPKFFHLFPTRSLIMPPTRDIFICKLQLSLFKQLEVECFQRILVFWAHDRLTSNSTTPPPTTS